MRAPLPSLPVARQVSAIVGLFILIVGLLLVLAHAQATILTGVRAYVGGEALWSKGQKDAVHYLRRYAETGDERDFEHYERALGAPLGDRQARLELEKGDPDMDVVRDGFVRARNHPDDVPAMAWLFRRFRRVPYMAHAIDVWATADLDIARIHRLGAMLHEQRRSPAAVAVRPDGLVRKVTVLNDRLTPLEEEFSSTLGMGARRAATLLLGVTYGAAGLLVSAGILLSVMMLHRLRGWETRYRHLLNSANDGILVSDHDTGVILEANRRAGELMGVPVEQLVGMRQALLHPMRDQARYAEVEQALRAGRPTTTALHLRHADGHLVPVEISAAVTQLDGRRVVQSLVRDVTERERSERELRESEERYRDLFAREQVARVEAERANRVKDEFLSVLSHELRTPLTPVLVWARMLQRVPVTPELSTRGLQAIERNARAQAQLIEDLLDVSRIIAGKLRLQRGPVDLAAVVDGAVEAARPAAELKGIDLALDLDRDIGTVSGDPGRLRQVVANLLSNAIKFTPAEGAVTVRLSRDDAGVALAVSDTGAGIACDFLPHVFERFRQADSSTTRAHAGLGIGLSIVRHLVELHAGTVVAESEGEGRGATFTVRLPIETAVVPVTAGAAETGLAPSGANGDPSDRLRGLNVLVVEDEEDTRELVAVLLTRHGAETRSAPSSAEALVLAERWDFDVLVSDIGMPGDDGYTLLGHLNAARAGTVPAVALTAYARLEDRERARAAGFQRYVAKPFDPDELVEAVRRLGGR